MATTSAMTPYTRGSIGLRPGIASAYSIPMEDSEAILAGTAMSATTIMYIIMRNRTAETTFEKKPNTRQNLV